MSAAFFDSPALVKRYRLEVGSAKVADIIDFADRIGVARLAHVEVTSAIVRIAKGSHAPPSDLQRIVNEIDRDFATGLEIMELDQTMTTRARHVAVKHALRAADAIQLSCALQFRDELEGEPLTLVASDLELNQAAAREGFTVIDPMLS